MKTKEINRILIRMGYQVVRNNRHTVWSNGSVTVMVPQHSTISKYLAKQTLKQIGCTEDVDQINYKAA